MILGITLYTEEKNGTNTTSLYSIPFPQIEGLISFNHVIVITSEFSIENIITAIILNALLIYIVLKTSSRIERYLESSYWLLQ